MRGGFVACLAASNSTASRLEAAASFLKWHTGEPSFHHHRGFQIACLTDDVHGPCVEFHDGRLLLCHGAQPQPLDQLERCDRFVGVESDGSSLRAIRDPMGEVPLYYRRVGEELWLATEIHPLIAIAAGEPDVRWLSAFCAGMEYSDTTGWSGLRRALPGEILEVDSELHVSSRRYFRPSVGRRRGGPSPEEAALRFRELFTIAVAKRSSGRCGVLLSGGLDSSAVALIAAQSTRPTLLTVNHPTLPEVNETSYAEAIAAATGIPLATLEIEVETWDPADEIRVHGVPPLGVPTGMYGLGLRTLAEMGCEAALDGHGGDGALGNPFARYANTVLDGHLDRLAAAVRRGEPRFVLSEIVKGFVSPSVLSRLLHRPVSPGYPVSFLTYFRGETALRFAAENRWQPPRAGWERQQLKALHPPTTQFFEEFELLGASHGIDVRHPFADRDLIDFLIRLPHAVKASTLRPKPLLLDGLADLLPSPVPERDGKTPVTAVLDARVDFENCYRWVRDSGVRLPDIDYGRLFRDAAKPVNDRIFWARLATAHVFLAGV